MLNKHSQSFCQQHKGPLWVFLEQKRDREAEDQRRASPLPTQGHDGQGSPPTPQRKGQPTPATRSILPDFPPQQHLASLAGCGLLKGKHLKVMTIGSGVLGVDVGADEGREFHAMEQDSAIKGNDVPVHAAAYCFIAWICPIAFLHAPTDGPLDCDHFASE